MLLLHYPFMLSALALCLLLTGVLSAFGHHVVKRGVIFVDLALAQMAALGASVGMLLGFGETHPFANFLLSLSFTLLGAALFSWFRSRRGLPIEALIGITYAGAMALSLIVLEKSATGTEELKEMLIGSILTVSREAIGWAALLTTLTAGILWMARKPLLQITAHPETALSQGRRLWWWDFVFYAAFGIMVTFAVKTAGVLLVFAFLIVPSLAAILVFQATIHCLLFGWIFGVVGCIFGLEASLRLDTSAGPTLVASYILLLALTGGIVRRLRR